MRGRRIPGERVRRRGVDILRRECFLASEMSFERALEVDNGLFRLTLVAVLFLGGLSAPPVALDSGGCLVTSVLADVEQAGLLPETHHTNKINCVCCVCVQCSIMNRE